MVTTIPVCLVNSGSSSLSSTSGVLTTAIRSSSTGLGASSGPTRCACSDKALAMTMTIVSIRMAVSVPARGVKCLRDGSGNGDVLVKPVADAADAQDIRGLLEVVLDLFSQRSHVGVHGPVRHVDILAPDRLEELVARDHLARPLQEQREDLKLGAGEQQFGVAFEGEVPPQVHPDGAPFEQ